MSALALAPVEPMPASAALTSTPAVSALAVQLAATIDPITPWESTFEAAARNLGASLTDYASQPFPILNAISENVQTYLQELPDFELVGTQIADNAKAFFNAPLVPNPENISKVVFGQAGSCPGFLCIDLTQYKVWNLLPLLAGDELYSQLKPVLDLTTTPISAELLGFIGPGLSSLIQLTESFTAVGRYIEEGDAGAALNEIINIPANVTNAGLNGGKYLDLTGLVGALGIELPASLTSLGIRTGGLLNAGGVAFDSVAAQAKLLGLDATVPGFPIGLLGATIDLGQAVGEAMTLPAPVEPTALAAAAEPAASDAPATGADTPAAADTAEASAAVEEAPVDAEEAPVDAEAPAAAATPQRSQVAPPADGDDSGTGRTSRAARTGRNAG